MDFSDAFNAQFSKPEEYVSADLDLNKKLQDTRHALQEATSEIDELKKMIAILYSESLVEHDSLDALMTQLRDPLFKNMPTPRNRDHISLSEKAGYAVFYMKFLGHVSRTSTEEHFKVREHLQGIHKSIKSHTAEVEIARTGQIKLPELDGIKELKIGVKPKSPISPPITPPEQKTHASSKKLPSNK